MIGVGIIGYGYWGPNLVRNFAETPGARVVAVSDLRAERLSGLRTRYPTIRATDNYREMIDDPSIDAIVVATPVSTHYALAMEALRAGKHALIEKPLAGTVEQGQRLVDEAAGRRLVLMVDHTFLYTEAVRKIKQIADEGRLGPIYYYDSVRVNLGLFQHDVNVLWDLAVHDLSIMDYVLAKQPSAVTAVGASHVGDVEDIAYLTCLFDDSLIAHIHVNWLAPVKVRRTLIGGTNRMIVYDDLEPSEKVKVYDKGITVGPEPHSDSGNGHSANGNGNGAEAVRKLLVGYRLGDMWAPQLGTTEALQVEACHFVECVEQGRKPISDGESGLRLVRILEAATRSLAKRGEPVEMNWEEIRA